MLDRQPPWKEVRQAWRPESAAQEGSLGLGTTPEAQIVPGSMQTYIDTSRRSQISHRRASTLSHPGVGIPLAAGRQWRFSRRLGGSMWYAGHVPGAEARQAR